MQGRQKTVMEVRTAYYNKWPFIVLHRVVLMHLYFQEVFL